MKLTDRAVSCVQGGSGGEQVAGGAPSRQSPANPKCARCLTRASQVCHSTGHLGGCRVKILVGCSQQSLALGSCTEIVRMTTRLASSMDAVVDTTK